METAPVGADRIPAARTRKENVRHRTGTEISGPAYRHPDYDFSQQNEQLTAQINGLKATESALQQQVENTAARLTEAQQQNEALSLEVQQSGQRADELSTQQQAAVTQAGQIAAERDELLHGPLASAEARYRECAERERWRVLAHVCLALTRCR